MHCMNIIIFLFSLSSLYPSSDDEADANEAQQSDRFTSTSGTQRIKIKSLKEDLASKLAEPLIPRGVSKSYITRNASVNGLSVPNIMIKNQESAKGFLLPTKMKTTAIADLKAKVFKRIRSG